MAIVQPSFCTLPENIVLDIFHYLPLKDLCRICRVCKQWRRIVHDKKLWKHVDMMEHPMSLRKMWKFVRAHFSDCLLSLKLKGFMYSKAGAKRWKKETLSDAMLKELKERCPNLKELWLSHANMESINSICLPEKLQKLVIVSSCIPVSKDWMTHFPVLSHIDLSYSPAVSATLLFGLGSRRELETLKLNGCYRLFSAAETLIGDLWKQFVCLKRLEVAGTSLTNLVLHHICRNNVSLKHLNLSENETITDAGLANILECLVELESLNLSKCSLTISLVHAQSFKNLKKLSTLNLMVNNVSEEARFNLAEDLPNISIKIEESLNDTL